MSGIVWAISAGVGFGVFQAVNRRANSLVDAYRGTFALLVVSFVILAAATALTQPFQLLRSAPAASLGLFALAGFVHFFVGWTLLGFSQQRVGAARTGALLGSVPLFGMVLAALILRESVPSRGLVGVLLVVVGVVVLSRSGARGGTGTAKASSNLFGLGAAACWGLSPIFIRWGLDGLPSPLLGVTVGMGASALVYGIVLAFRRPRGRIDSVAARWLALAGILVGVSIASLWIALDLSPVAVVLTVVQIATPVVILVSPMIVGRQLERVTSRVWVGAGAIVTGAVILILSGG